jgi:hypothetical protein
MKITFQYNKEIDLRKLLFHLVEIHRGFFIEHGFYLTTQIDETTSNFVVIPKWEELQSAQLWKQIEEMSNQMKKDPHYYLKTDLSKFKELVTKFDELEDIDISVFESEWKKVEKEILDYCNSNLNLKNINLDIYLTRFGAKCSYALQPGRVVSMPINSIKYINSNIVFSLLSSTIHEYADDQKHNVSWKEKQVAIDSVIKSTKLSELLKQYTNVVDDIKAAKINNSLIESDRELYKFLGIESKTEIEFINNQILINTKLIDFTKGEADVFKLLYTHKNKPVTYEQIADFLWSQHVSHKYSLEAINKKIERIRKKIKTAGIHTPIIRTKNNIGYYID